MAFNGWSLQQNKIFEEALAAFSDVSPDMLHKIAEKVAGKSARDVYMHYEVLLKDIKDIDSGKVELPSYKDVFYSPKNTIGKFSDGSCEISFELRQIQPRDRVSNGSYLAPTIELPRERGWKRISRSKAMLMKFFLKGLQKCPKGDWRGISRKFVVTRTPTQIASHAQKYYKRQEMLLGKKNKKRASIHDMSVDDLDIQATEELRSTQYVSNTAHKHSAPSPQVGPTQSYGSSHYPMASQFSMHRHPCHH
ncbi:hypothetical protein AMTRI_Chr11g150970 [Amborella trichopoda]